MAGIIIGCLISFSFGYLLGSIAEKRGTNVVIGPFAIPFVFLTKPKSQNE
jgi:hypothetical protein